MTCLSCNLAIMKDFGRNDPCPCFSRKKYKRCHGIESAQLASAPALPNQYFLGAFDTEDLVKTFAALTILPENHGENCTKYTASNC